jgi:hypothetical protein
MTDTPYDRAPGDSAASTEVEQGTRSDVGIYTIGLEQIPVRFTRSPHAGRNSGIPVC